MKLNTLMMLMALATAGQAAAKPLVIATDATYPLRDGRQQRPARRLRGRSRLCLVRGHEDRVRR